MRRGGRGSPACLRARCLTSPASAFPALGDPAVTAATSEKHFRVNFSPYLAFRGSPALRLVAVGTPVSCHSQLLSAHHSCPQPPQPRAQGGWWGRPPVCWHSRALGSCQCGEGQGGDGAKNSGLQDSGLFLEGKVWTPRNHGRTCVSLAACPREGAPV